MPDNTAPADQDQSPESSAPTAAPPDPAPVGEVTDAAPDPAPAPAPAAPSEREANIVSARNRALREANAYKKILQAHNISIDSVNDSSLNQSIDDGKVTSDFQYQAPKVHVAPRKAQDASPPSGRGLSMTRQDVENMSPEDINKNWDAISKQLKSGGLNNG